ncbi:unnamed protein product [Phytomonas sp. Hart1]|nr:unnamed protein product [Phytomonas sp. Hart1]|eukprot:CCW66910.1 unnamed protein product [Phytomonas sp. isolate Hart1]
MASHFGFFLEHVLAMNNSSKYFVVSPSWVAATAEAIGSRNGVKLKDSLTAAEQGQAVTIQNDSPATLSGLVDSLYDTLTGATREYWQHHPLLAAPEWPQSDLADRQEKERVNATETALRVAITGALACYQRAQQKCISLQELGGNVAEEEGPTDCLERSIHNTLLKGLLFAFEAFKELHAMRREHYVARVGHRTTGTIGWDTLVLLHFVHHIPQIARCASGAVIDDATGQIVRSWRRLLVDLQGVDADEAPEHSRRRGALALVNGLLQILFQRYNTHQCAVLLRSVDHAEVSARTAKDSMRSILQPSQHMTSEVVAYHYYHGRMRIYERCLDEAHEDLRRAYTLLPPPGSGTEPQRRNKQRVRFFLAVAGLASGRKIPAEILRADGLLPWLFGALESAITRGDSVAFGKALERHGAVWRRRGVYLILQRAKPLCYAMLVVRVHGALSELPNTDSTRITLRSLVAAYHAVVGDGKAQTRRENSDAGRKHVRKAKLANKRVRQDQDSSDDDDDDDETVEAMDDDRMMLWVAKVISLGYVRGYLSHEHKTLVVARNNAFPFLSKQ